MGALRGVGVFSMCAFVLLGTLGCKETYKGTLDLIEGIQVPRGLSSRDLKLLAACKQQEQLSKRCKRLVRKFERNLKPLSSGTYDAHLEVSENKARFRLRLEPGAKEIKFSLPLPAGIDRADEGFYLESATTALPFDIKGEWLENKLTHGAWRTEARACTYTATHTECYWVRQPYPCWGRRGRSWCVRVVRECRPVLRYYSGVRDVTYRVNTVYKRVGADFLTPTQETASVLLEEGFFSEGQLMGSFEGEYTSSYEEERGRGVCVPY